MLNAVGPIQQLAATPVRQAGQRKRVRKHLKGWRG
jgi:hypothetical protein